MSPAIHAGTGLQREAFDSLTGVDQSPDDSLEGVQQLIDSGQGWLLEGSVGRAMAAAIEDGAAVLGPVGHRDYWGNRIPSRDEVVPGTKGSVRYAHSVGGVRFGHTDTVPCPRCEELAVHGLLRGPRA